MIPYGRQWIDENDVAAVAAALRGNFLTQGPHVAQFEAQLSDQCGSAAAVACNSGTAALHMAYSAMGIGPGDVVVVPANTFLATANAAIYLGAEVRFCDVDAWTGLMTVQTLDAVLDGDVSLVVPVHFAGMPCDMPAIAKLVRAKAPRAKIVEDASHAIGATHADGSPVGSLKYSSMATFSFHPVKHIAAGEGGAVTVDDPGLLGALQRFRCHGMTKDPARMIRRDEGPWYYEMQELGFNYRIPDAACALASSQMKRLDQFLERRRAIARSYLAAWKDLSAIVLPPIEQLEHSAWHLFCLHIREDRSFIDRRTFMEHLAKLDVGSQVHYYPVCGQPFYRERYGCDEQNFTGAFTHYETELSVPIFPAMSDQEIRTVISAIRVVASEATISRSRAA